MLPQRDVHELANPVSRIVVVSAFRLDHDALEHFSSLPLIEPAIGDPKERRVCGHRVPHHWYELKTAVCRHAISTRRLSSRKSTLPASGERITVRSLSSTRAVPRGESCLS